MLSVNIIFYVFITFLLLSTNAMIPTIEPSYQPTFELTDIPTFPTINPSKRPSTIPSMSPSKSPTIRPTFRPSKVPTYFPSATPSLIPTKKPTNIPSTKPSFSPTINPSRKPTRIPTSFPTMSPTTTPTTEPTTIPTDEPSFEPTYEVTEATETLATTLPSTNSQYPTNSVTFLPSSSAPLSSQQISKESLSEGAMIGIIVGGVVFLLFILLILRYIYTLGVVSIKEKEGINKEVEETAAKELLTTDPDVDTAQQISCPESTKSTYKMKDLTEIPVDDATKDTCISETDVLVLDTSANSEKIKPVNRFGFFSLSTVRSIRVRSPPRPTSAPITTPENTPDRDAEIMIGIDSSEISAPSDDISLKQLRDKTIAVTNSLKSISKDAETPIDVLVLTESTQSPQETHIPMQIQPVIDNWMSVDRPAPISDPLAPLIFNSNNSSYTQTSAYNSPVTPLLPGQSPLIDIMSPIRYTTPSIPQTQSLRSSSVPNVSTLTTNISTSAHYYSESNSAPRFTGT